MQRLLCMLWLNLLTRMRRMLDLCLGNHTRCMLLSMIIQLQCMLPLHLLTHGTCMLCVVCLNLLSHARCALRMLRLNVLTHAGLMLSMLCAERMMPHVRHMLNRQEPV